jgi:GDP-L-fucose synthase
MFVDDAADAIVFLLQRYSQADPINVGTGKEVSIRKLAETIAEVVGYRGELVFDASRPDGAPRKLLDSARLAALGWRPRTELADGLADMYRWYCKRKVDVAA